MLLVHPFLKTFLKGCYLRNKRWNGKVNYVTFYRLSYYSWITNISYWTLVKKSKRMTEAEILKYSWGYIYAILKSGEDVRIGNREPNYGCENVVKALNKLYKVEGR